jgi:PAS domain S-box-containing protein
MTDPTSPLAPLPLHLHLLVVDDDDVDRERVLRLLGRTALRFEVMEASSSSEALKLLRAHEFDCVMLDNQLGDASGAALLPAIHQAALRSCPVIMITGAGNESLAVQALQLGAADYLTKFNLNADVLVRAIHRAMDHHRLRQELDDLHLRLEQRVAQQAVAILQSERDLRAILDHTPTVIGYWDSTLHNRFGNRAWRRWCGTDPERLPGRHLAEVLGGPALQRIRARIDAVLQGESQHFEQAEPAPDAAGLGPGLRHAQWSLHPDFGDDGVVRGFYSSISDVSVIKQAQARAEELADFNEALFAHSPVGLGVVDGSGCCVLANQALARLVGARVADLVGLPLAALAGGSHGSGGNGDLAHLLATCHATLADGLPRRVELDVHTAFGSRLQASCAWARVEREGHSHGLLAVQDMAEQRRTNDALVAARDAAEQATRTKSQFLANMSHEIRTPMNAIVGLTQLALGDDLPPQTRDFIDKAHHSAHALMGLLDDVLDYSKVEAGQLHIEHLPLDIEQVVQRSVDLFSARIEQKGLAFDVELSPALPRCVLGDPLRLSQVLNNLLGNAVKFTERGQVRLTVQPLAARAPAPDMVRFAVRDSGVGIAAAQQAGLFEAFTQADATITRRFGGTGLGLAICRRLVTMMHGSIGLDSTPGVGSEFWFTVRLDRAPVTLPEDDSAPLAGLRVLLAVPESRHAGLLCERLRSWQVQARATADEAELLAALAQARAGGPSWDAVLIDQACFGGPARSTLRRLREAGAPVLLGMVPVVRAGSGHDASAAALPDVLLARPVLPSALRAALAALRGGAPPAGQAGTAGATLARPGLPAAPVAADARPLHGLQLLLVEDNDTNRLVAQVWLERLGASVLLAADGAQALAQLQAQPGDGGARTVHAVLMDMHMPVMDGLQATRRLRAIPALAGLPVVGMTAAAMAEDRIKCFDAGMVDVVTKPIDIERLVDCLLHCTGRRQRQPAGVRRIELPGFDLTALRQLLHGNEALVGRMLSMFARQEAATAAEVAALVAAHDATEACRRLHQLRGGAGSLGAVEVAQAALALERALRERRPLQAELAAFGRTLRGALASITALALPVER